MFVWDPIQGRYVSNGEQPRFFFGFVWSYPAERKPYVPEYDAFKNQPDPPELKICRGCSEADYIEEHKGEYGTVTERHKSLVHPCDGNGCQCPMCEIAGTMKEINATQDLLDRWQL